MEDYKQDINGYWGNLWRENRQGLDISDTITPFKFKYFLKPFLDKVEWGGAVCEVGSGNCQWLLLIHAYRPDIKLYGVDLTDEAVKIGKEYGIKVTQTDTRDVPLEDGIYDFVYSWGVIEHMEESDKALSEQYRIAKKFLSIDVPYKKSFLVQRNIKRLKDEGKSDYEIMIEHGKAFDKDEFKELLYEVVSKDDKIKIMNNYIVMPYRLRKFEKFLPEFVRKKIGHNIGAVIEKN